MQPPEKNQHINLSPGLSKKYSAIELLLIIVLSGVILYFGKPLLIPLSFSVLISFILYPVCIVLEKKGLKPGLAITVSLLTLFVIAFILAFIFITQLRGFLLEWENLKTSFWNTIETISGYILQNFNMGKDQQIMIFEKLAEEAGSLVIPFLKMTMWSFSVSLVLAVLMPVFSGLILYNRKTLVRVLYRLFPDADRNNILIVLQESVHAYYNFVKGMLLVYLVVGALNSIGLAILGIPHPVLFGFIASVLTFIPYVGIMIASLLPIAVSWVTFNSVWYPVGVVIVFSIVQLLEAYIIFPFMVGKKLQINTLVMLSAIIIGGIFWGAAGTILFVPFVAILKLIADRTEKLKTLALFLSSG